MFSSPDFFLDHSSNLILFFWGFSDSQIDKIAGCGIPPPTAHPSCPLIYVVEGGGAKEGKSVCRGTRGDCTLLGRSQRLWWEANCDVVTCWHTWPPSSAWVATVECCSPESPSLLPHDTEIIWRVWWMYLLSSSELLLSCIVWYEAAKNGADATNLCWC